MSVPIILLFFGLVHKQPLLAARIKKLEENYDKEYFEEKGGFEEWLKRQGIDKLRKESKSHCVQPKGARQSRN